jgi:transcriptional regulator with XRE-family HTH domain
MMRKRLIAERKARRWTQRFVAEQLGITISAYQHYEYGDREPSLSTANKLEDLFGIPQRELLVRDSTPNDVSA